jgi:ParB-like chromosome segregation protein Spo0J
VAIVHLDLETTAMSDTVRTSAPEDQPHGESQEVVNSDDSTAKENEQPIAIEIAETVERRTERGAFSDSQVAKGENVRIEDVKIGSRVRTDFGNLSALAASIKQIGLLHPIGVTTDMQLVFGERRLRACRDMLKWEEIPARIIPIEALLLGQFDENAVRKDFTVSERLAIVESLRTSSHGGDRKSDQVRNCELDAKRPIEVLAEQVGLGKDSFYRAKEVLEKGIPEVVEQMDAGTLSLHAAATIAQGSPEEQQKCLQMNLDGDRLTAKKLKKNLKILRRAKEREAAADEFIASPAPDSIQIYHCPFQELIETGGIEPGSVHLVCTDIPYGGAFLNQVEELARFAAEVLADGGIFVSYLGQHRLDEKLIALGKHLKYGWLASSVWSGRGTDVPRLKLISKTIPIAIFTKGQWDQQGRWIDLLEIQSQEKEWHEWQRPLEEVKRLVSYFSRSGDLVVDPCGGGFTTAIACSQLQRRFVGCDVDKLAVINGRKRVAQEHIEPTPSCAQRSLSSQLLRMPRWRPTDSQIPTTGR